VSREPVRLRDVEESDFEILFEHQLDPEAVAMAAFPSRDHDAHIAHWRKISADDACITKAIVVGDTVAGNIGSWSQDGHQEVGYWIGKEHWGKGIASTALALLLNEVAVRPIYAWVVSSNAASIRVLEKAGLVFERTDGTHRVYRIDG
jgi:RimJ/RimL family protein N-acetyltransferase